MLVASALLAGPLRAGAADHEPSVLHGLGDMTIGTVLAWPLTILEASMHGPPVAGTVVGVMAGAARAAQTFFAGAVEVSTAFDPWGTKKRRR
jgi:hypothetical protein